jgi:hypothetical protein
VICRYPSDREEKGSHVSGDDRFLARLITLRTCTGRAGRTMLPPLDVVDWWEHPGELRLTVARGVSAGSMSPVSDEQRWKRPVLLARSLG